MEPDPELLAVSVDDPDPVDVPDDVDDPERLAVFEDDDDSLADDELENDPEPLALADPELVPDCGPDAEEVIVADEVAVDEPEYDVVPDVD